MKLFDTKVQELKYKVLKEVAKASFEGNLLNQLTDIPKKIVPGPIATMRCCVYKERAVVSERIKLAMGGDRTNPNIIEVIDIACDECPVRGYEVSNACRGCIAHRCQEYCPKNAITFDHAQKAHIDKSKCIECGICAKVCPYSAIVNYKRPCENSCKIHAIYMDKNNTAKIDNNKCIQCGACVYQCPFGAIMDKSFLLHAIELLQTSDRNQNYRVYAAVAPSISSQFGYAKLGQVISGLKALGFYQVAEVALGADLIAEQETKELSQQPLLTSSCCPAFVKYIEKNYPTLETYISSSLSPMAQIGKRIKSSDHTSKVIFIGPCTAKKAEVLREDVKPYIDCVLTFEELQAMFDAKKIDISTLEDTDLDQASYFGRIVARSGGMSEAIGQALKEQGLEGHDYKPVVCDGIEDCRTTLTKAAKNALNCNFIEGMACQGGCIGGAGCLTHGPKTKAEVNHYGKEASTETIQQAISGLDKHLNF